MVSKMVNDSFVYSMRCIVIGLKLETLQMEKKRKTTLMGKFILLQRITIDSMHCIAFDMKKKKKN